LILLGKAIKSSVGFFWESKCAIFIIKPIFLWKKKEEEKVIEPVDIQTGIKLLLEQIEQAKQLLNARPIKSKDLSVWNNQTRECLIQIYGKRSPNVDTIVEASGEAPAWLFMPDDIRFQALFAKILVDFFFDKRIPCACGGAAQYDDNES
jgi:hypothetical protein